MVAILHSVSLSNVNIKVDILKNPFTKTYVMVIL